MFTVHTCQKSPFLHVTAPDKKLIKSLQHITEHQISAETASCIKMHLEISLIYHIIKEVKKKKKKNEILISLPISIILSSPFHPCRPFLAKELVHTPYLFDYKTPVFPPNNPEILDLWYKTYRCSFSGLFERNIHLIAEFYQTNIQHGIK